MLASWTGLFFFSFLHNIPRKWQLSQFHRFPNPVDRQVWFTPPVTGLFASRFPCQVSAFELAGKLYGFFAVCRRKETSVALQCSAWSLADLKRFSLLSLSLSIQSLRQGCVCVCAETEPLHGTVHLTDWKPTPPPQGSAPQLSSSSLNRVGLLIYSGSYTKGGTEEREAVYSGEWVEKGDWRADFGAPQHRSVEVVFKTKERTMRQPSKEWFMHGNES